MNQHNLGNRESLNPAVLILECILSWYEHVTDLVSFTANKLGFLLRTRKYFSSSNLYTLFIPSTVSTYETTRNDSPPSRFCSENFFPSLIVKQSEIFVFSMGISIVLRGASFFNVTSDYTCSISTGSSRMHPFSDQPQKSRTSNVFVHSSSECQNCRQN